MRSSSNIPLRGNATRRAGRIAAAAAAACLVALGAAAASEGPAGGDKTVQVATLHWPPYTGHDLPDGGAVTAVVRAAFAEVGRQVEVHYWPWKRAIAKAKSGSDGVIAYFPGYHCHHDPASDFVASRSMGTAPLGFAEHRDAEYSWSTLKSLEQFRIGTVVGYANTERFDERAAAGELRVISSDNDASNLRRLLNKRVDYAVVDKYVMAYLLRTKTDLRQHSEKVRFDEKELEVKNLYMCFRDDARGRALRKLFDQGLERIAADEILHRRIEELVK